MHNRAHPPRAHVSDLRLAAAIVLNLLLTVAEIAGGLVSGSLALLADALHNLNDCGCLVIALVAGRIARQRADHRYTFGYRRAEVVGALINLTTLIAVSLYLVGEAVWRYFSPQQVEGWIVVIVAAVALAVDGATVLFLLAMSRGNLNLRAALLHNLADTFASLGVILAGVAVLLWDLWEADVLIAMVIAGYILWHSLRMIRQSIAILMESTPEGLDLRQLVREAQAVQGVRSLHHIHVWQLDEQHNAMEAHVVLDPSDGATLERIKHALKQRLELTFGITHSTLEFEFRPIPDDLPSHDTSILSSEH
jgi:cobalt-zinc-cadmium efflux system protein